MTKKKWTWSLSSNRTEIVFFCFLPIFLLPCLGHIVGTQWVCAKWAIEWTNAGFFGHLRRDIPESSFAPAILILSTKVNGTSMTPGDLGPNSRTPVAEGYTMCSLQKQVVSTWEQALGYMGSIIIHFLGSVFTVAANDDHVFWCLLFAIC